MSEFNRRNLLKGLGAGALFLTSPEKLLMGTILDGMLNRAQAAASQTNEKILINIFLQSGPARWYFDLPLRPNGNDAIIENAMVKNRFELENGILKPVFDTHKVGDFHLPYLWKSNIPTSDGLSVPMANLAQSALFVRGYDLINDGHDQNRIRHNAPISGAPSLSGIFADNSSKPFSAVTDGPTFQHKSALGKSIINAPRNGDPFSSMMAPFNLNNPKSFNRRQAMDDSIKALQRNISSFFGSKNPYASSLASEKDSSIELFLKGTTGLKEKYSALYNKYRNLEVRAFTESNLEGIDDKEIPLKKGHDFHITGHGANIKPNIEGGDFRSIIDINSRTSSMAEGFAIAEYIVTENLSSSLILVMNDIINLNLSSLNYHTFEDAAVGNLQHLNFDSHETGSHASLYLYSQFYRAFAANLYEFIRVLKNKNLYKDSIIQLSSEFNRAARTAGHGSDHGFNGSGTSFYSGMFETGNGPLVIGNVKNNATGGGYAGTWGVAAPVPELGNREIGIGNLMSTVTSLANYESPTKNDSPLVKILNGNLINLAGKPKNVA